MIPRQIRPLALLAAMAVATLGCSMLPGATTPPTPAPVASEAGGGGTGSCPTAQPAALQAGETRTVTIATDLGDMKLKIQGDLSPIAAGNFVALAECGFYDGVVFHRVVPQFVIQGGDPTGTGSGGPGYTIQDEPVTTQYSRGTVAMARTQAPNSVGSQFFIVLDDGARDSLAAANTYQIIGSVAEGMETADKIAAAADAELPSDPVAMNDVSVSNP
ncbi:MAG TPA: peptidylprolyl isomerase [Patescibacteria group bacterium]|jgi:cyclophilin family peptidyl-prolyl cis-trans isomerase|nr:peptidylprolyl isomerase [Patescibacteria group bacterium]